MKCRFHQEDCYALSSNSNKPQRNWDFTNRFGFPTSRNASNKLRVAKAEFMNAPAEPFLHSAGKVDYYRDILRGLSTVLA